MRAPISLLPCFLVASLGAAEAGLPLPEAPVRILIPEAGAFDGALTGGYRAFLSGRPRNGDPLVTAWRRTQVGSKLEDQWLKLSQDLPWTWGEIRKLQPRSLGLALLDVGHLEAVLVIDTPLAVLPANLPAGTRASYGGVAYARVSAGAADGSGDPDRRMGLAWARLGSRLLLATSERALKLAIDEAQAGRGLAPPLPGLVSMELDLDRLRKDRYFRREFPFPEGPETGKVRVALVREGDHLVEVREGRQEPRGGVYTFAAPGAGAIGWEPEGQPFWPALRQGLLEPIPAPSERPVPALGSLPSAAASAPEDRYSVNLTRPLAAPGAPPWEEGDLAPWRALLTQQPVPSWGFWVGPGGTRRLVFPWPESRDAEFLELCRRTVARRAGTAAVVRAGEAQEIRVGPGLAALALRRTGPFLWVAPSAADLKDAPLPRAEGDLVRWARVDLGAVRAEGPRWAKVEGPPRPEQVRPLSDRVLGLLGWMPATTSIAVERRRTPTGWTERVVFGTGVP